MVVATLVSAVLMQTVAFTAVASGANSHIDQPRQVIIRSVDEWQTLWKSHSAEPAPKVDFSQSIVVGVFLGTRPTAGYSVQIAAVRRTADGAVVEYVERKPAPSGMRAQVLTSPFDLIAIPKDIQKIEFKALAGG